MTQAETTLGVVLFPTGEEELEEEDGGGRESQEGRDADSSTAEGKCAEMVKKMGPRLREIVSAELQT